MKKTFQSGQVLIILLLIILVSLTIGLAVVQNSLVDISISTKSDQSTRAFSAAEAGLETALITNSSIVSSPLGNQSSFQVNVQPNLPDPAKPGQALEYPPVTKADFAQFWFKDPTTDSSSTKDYLGTTFSVYFGNCEANSCFGSSDPLNPKPALEVNVIKRNTTNSAITSKKYFES